MATRAATLHLDFEILELQTRDPFHLSRQAAPAARHSAWVRIRDGDGMEGWGEAVAVPYYGETAETIRVVLPRLGEALERSAAGDPFALERIERALRAAVSGNGGAHAGVSAALHDLVGKRLGVPLWKLWGLDAAAPVSSFTIGLDEPEVMRERVRAAAGYPVLKLKIGTGRDEEILRLVREEAPAATIRVDANTAWNAEQALAALPMLETYRVELVEQPLPAADFDGLRRLRQRSPIPIIADESCVTLTDVARLAGVVDGINLKLSKCGGLREALRMVHAARAHGMRVMLGCMIESTLGIAAAVQLSPLVDYLDLDGAALLAADPFRGPGIASDGTVRFNTEPGLGVGRNLEFRILNFEC